MDDFVLGICQKLFCQFRFNFDTLAPYSSPNTTPYAYLEKSKAAGAPNLDGSEIRLSEADPWGLDRVCHLNAYFAYDASLIPYTFKDDGFKASNHVTYENTVSFYQQPLFSFADPIQYAPLIFPTDRNFFCESLLKRFLATDVYSDGPLMPIYHSTHKAVFTPLYFRQLTYEPALLTLRVAAPSQDAVKTIYFALTMLFNLILIESAFIDLWGVSRQKFLRKSWQDQLAKAEGAKLLAFLLASLHPAVYAACRGLFMDRFSMRNTLGLITPPWIFLFW